MSSLLETKNLKELEADSRNSIAELFWGDGGTATRFSFTKKKQEEQQSDEERERLERERIEAEHRGRNMELERLASQADDDFGFRTENSPQPLDTEYYNKEHVSENLQKEMEYWAATGEIESNTERSNVLQDIVDKLTSFKTKVYIINKGEEPQAFVYPDGSIFISQSLLNRCVSIDQAAAILAHEIGHLELKTFERKQTGGSLSVSWLHEGLSDTYILNKLSAAGYSTEGYKVLKKIGKLDSRSIQHMTLATRATMLNIIQNVHDYEGSEKGTSALPVSLYRETKPSNLEVLRNILDVQENELEYVSVNAYEEIIKKLHPKDFKTALECFPKRGNYSSENRDNKIRLLQHIFLSELRHRINLLKHENDDEHIWDLTIQSNLWELDEQIPVRDIMSPESLAIFQAASQEFITNEKAEVSSKELFFGGDVPIELDKLGVSAVMARFVGHDLYSSERFPESLHGYPFTEDSLLDFIALCQNEKKWGQLEDRKKEIFGNVLFRYVKSAWLFDKSSDLVDLDQETSDKILAFYQKAKARGITLSEEYIPEPDRSYEKQEYGSETLYINPERSNKAIQIIRDFISPEKKGPDWERVKQNLLSIILSPFRERGGSYPRLDIEEIQKALQDTLKRYLPSYSAYHTNFEENEQIRARVASMAKEIVMEISLPPDAVDLRRVWSELTQEAVAPQENLDFVRRYMYSIVVTGLWQNTASPQFYQELEYCYPTDYSVGTSSLAALEIIIAPMLQLREINNPAKFSEILPLVKYLSVQAEASPCTNLDEFLKKIESLGQRSWGANELFDFNLKTVILMGNLRRSLHEILERPISDEQLSTLHTIIRKVFPDSPERREWLRALDLKFFDSAEVSVTAKVDHLVQNFESVGAHGMLKVAELISNPEDYNYFSEKMLGKLENFLSGGGIVSEAALADNVTARLGEELSSFKILVNSCTEDPEQQREITNQLAVKWLTVNSGAFEKSSFVGRRLVVYEKEENKDGVFWLSQAGNKGFRTVRDIVDYLRELSPVQRFALALKSLTDSGGALTSPEGRKELAELAVGSLELKDDFMKALFQAICLSSDPELLAGPLAQFFAPLLFRGYDMQQIDPANVKERFNKERFSDYYKEIKALNTDELNRILNSRTRQIVAYGENYRKAPDALLTKSVQESGRLHQEVCDQISRIVSASEAETPAAELESTETASAQISKTTEGLIEAGEMNPLTNRAMQLAVQLFPELEPAVRER
ncbi:MAG: M48 family metalloprotease, partial [Candidatus Gracilibacteria bacterium]|nr:M48 family metalloprotease [Candidatus Gracilibacteria bacterium]